MAPATAKISCRLLQSRSLLLFRNLIRLGFLVCLLWALCIFICWVWGGGGGRGADEETTWTRIDRFFWKLKSPVGISATGPLPVSQRFQIPIFFFCWNSFLQNRNINVSFFSRDRQCVYLATLRSVNVSLLCVCVKLLISSAGWKADIILKFFFYLKKSFLFFS